MSWVQLLQPQLVLQGPILELTLQHLSHHRIEGLILDVDETLVRFHHTQPTQEIRQWVDAIRPHATLWLVSNNVNETRICRIASELNLPYISGAGKPSRRKMRQVVSRMGVPLDQIAMVGDRVFTDVLVGNRMGLFTILVEPMVSPGEVIRNHPVRSVETWLSQWLGVSLQ